MTCADSTSCMAFIDTLKAFKDAVIFAVITVTLLGIALLVLPPRKTIAILNFLEKFGL